MQSMRVNHVLLVATMLAALTHQGSLLAAERVPWTGSRVVGSPDPPPPYEIVRAFPKLKFDRPIFLTPCPGSDRLFVGEQAGVIHSFPNRPDATAEVFLDLTKELQTLQLHPGAKGIDMVYGLAFHPDFERNRQCFICYTLESKDPKQSNLPDGTRVSRFTVTDTEPPRADPESEEIVLTFLEGGHNGCDMHFGPDGMLYISTGDATNPNPPDLHQTGQDISDLLSSILRIDVDRAANGKPYGIPPDNPFVNMADAAPEVWAYGFRNPWRMSFDRKTGELYVGDVGWELWESIHRVEKGGNYGWSAMEGPQPIMLDRHGPTPIHPPLIELPHTIACSITGGYVYRGSKLPGLEGAYVFGDWETRRIWAARFADGRLTDMEEITRPSVRVVAFGEDAAGELYFLDHDYGTIHSFRENSGGAANQKFPQTLAQTGLFSSVADHLPADGVASFEINSQQWHDGAKAEYWVGLPGKSAVTYHKSGKPIEGLVYWHNFRMHFPKDAVLLKTLSLGSQRIETQLLHYDGLDWRGYSYAWRDDQQDADLVPAEGAEKKVGDGNDVRYWQYHSRTQCMMCHSNQSEYALAFLPEQLNRQRDGANQLIGLTQAGIIERAGNNGELLPAFDAKSVAQEKRIPDPEDTAQSLTHRARGYLHANCGHCHSLHGGGTVPLRLQFEVPADDMQAIGVRPTRGDLGLAGAQIIKPGAPYASTLYVRMAKFGRDRMPHIGSEQPHEAGLQLIEDWIAGMEADKVPAHPVASLDAATIDSALAGLATALPVARQIGRQELKRGERELVLAAAAKLPDGLVRDLFDGFLPNDGKERRLGSNPRPQSILSLAGDAGRGEALFWSETVNCGKCHRMKERGTAVGPDLAEIGKQRSHREILESLLFPSRRIDAKYASYLIETVSGKLLTGMLVERNAQSIVFRDGEGRAIELNADEVEAMHPSRTSIMPEGQLANLTAQQAADLLAFLAARTEGG